MHAQIKIHVQVEFTVKAWHVHSDYILFISLMNLWKQNWIKLMNRFDLIKYYLWCQLNIVDILGFYRFHILTQCSTFVGYLGCIRPFTRDQSNSWIQSIVYWQYFCVIFTQGKLKPKRLQSLVQSLGESELGPYAGGGYTSPKGVTVKLEHVSVSQLVCGMNDGKVVMGRMVGSVPMDDPLP